MTQTRGRGKVNIKSEIIKAWGVHVYTMLGGVIGMLALVAISDNKIQIAWMLLIIAFIIDMTDGTLARRYQVSTILPQFDGAKIDDLIDFLTYVWAPILIIHASDLISNPVWLALPILGSLYAYGRPGMKEIDGEAYFIGFPSYWNVVALYLYWLQPIESVVIGLLIFFFILSFIPSRYLYPSKNPKYPQITLGVGFIWLITVIVFIVQPPTNTVLILVSLIYPIYYMLASFYVELSYVRENRRIQAG